jgi:hypothetical protein
MSAFLFKIIYYICRTNKYVMSKEDKVILSIRDTEGGLEVRINEVAYGNLAIVGLVEKIKMNLLFDNPPTEEKNTTVTKTHYDA